MILSTSKLNAKQYLMNKNVIKGGLLTLWFTFEELISIIVVQSLHHKEGQSEKARKIL